MIKIETQLGKFKVFIEAETVNEIFEKLAELKGKYQGEGISKTDLIKAPKQMGYKEPKAKGTLELSSLAPNAAIREPDTTLSELNKLVSIDNTGKITPLFPQGNFKTKELALVYFYANYVHGKTTPLKNVSEFLGKEGISQGAKDNMMSGLRKSRVIIQKEGEIELLNLPFARKEIARMASKVTPTK